MGKLPFLATHRPPVGPKAKTSKSPRSIKDAHPCPWWIWGWGTHFFYHFCMEIIFWPILGRTKLWKLVWNVAFLKICTTTASPMGSKSKFWLGRIPTMVLLINAEHLGASKHVKTKKINLFLAHFFSSLWRNCHFWPQIGHHLAQKPKNQNHPGRSKMPIHAPDG